MATGHGDELPPAAQPMGDAGDRVHHTRFCSSINMIGVLELNAIPGQSSPSTGDLQARISQPELERLASIRGEGDDWDFKASLGDLSETSARVNIAKDVLAFCNLPNGGTLVVGIADDFTRVGLAEDERIDTTAIRAAIEKYIDGDFTVLAAEHLLSEDGEEQPKRLGIIHVRRRSMQPVLAALDGNLPSGGQPKFRRGDILIRKGAASARANSGDVRALLTSSVVHEERVKAVNTLWTALVEQRRLLNGIETLYDVFAESEYGEAASRPQYAATIGSMTFPDLASKMDELQLRVSLVRPHIPDELYQQYRKCAAFVGRIHWKAIQQRDAKTLLAWTLTNDGSPDDYLRSLASGLLSSDEIEAAWNGQVTNVGTWRPIRPVIDATEFGLLEALKKVLSGLG